jgi:hypothetical protein
MPEYSSVLYYLPVLFATSVPLGKLQLLIITFYKIFRLEKVYLRMNLVFLAIMAVATVAAYLIFHSVLWIAIVSLVVIVLWECFADYYLMKKITISYSPSSMIIELIAIIAFIISTLFGRMAYSIGLFCVIIISCGIIQKKEIYNSFKRLFS